VSPKFRLGKKWRWSAICVLISVGSALAAWGLSASGLTFFRQLDVKVLDAHFVTRGRTPVNDIVLVTVDNHSLETISDLQMFWHPHYANAIRGVAKGGAKVMGLDIAFGVPVARWEPDYDQILAQAVAEVAPAMPVICIYVPEMMGKQRNEAFAVPLNMLAAGLDLAAFANLTVDADDFVRRQELYERPAEGPVARSFALKLAEKFLGVEAQFPNGRLVLGGRRVPVTPERAIRINYAGPPDTFPRVSLVDVLTAYKNGDTAQLERWFQGKAVLLGLDAIEDRRATPFYTFFSGRRWNTAGVEIHANTLHTLLSRRFLVPVHDYSRWLALLTAAGVTMSITISMTPAAAALWLTFWFGIILAGTHILFRNGLILSTFELLLACAICHLGAIVFRFFTAEKSSRLYHRAVSLFVGKELAQSLDEAGISRTGTRKFVTVLFSDIRGFTAFCDGKDPGIVVDLLNDYLERMCAIIVAHKGNVNKFIGDGILAIFSDDDEGAVSGDHPERAVRCGIAMAQQPGEFRTGVGIHSGLAVLGNVGSSDKMEYTVLGDTVNLASRLESLNKEHKTSLLLSEATQMLLEGRVETVVLAAVNVRGQAKPVEIFTAAALVPAPARSAVATDK
jgi:class 3 adenylate cyclase/CHASE2 domain-containing sensor protein